MEPPEGHACHFSSFTGRRFNRRNADTGGVCRNHGLQHWHRQAFGTVGPFLDGLLSNLTGGWTVPLIAFVVSAGVMVLGAFLLTRNRTFDDAAVSP